MTSHTATPSPMVLTNAGGADRTRRTATPSPMVYARIAGVLYLLIAVLSIFVHCSNTLVEAMHFSARL